jgi:site-specific recombinase XerD
LAFFAQMKEERIASLTYHKFSGELWPEQEFRTHKVSLVNGEQVSLIFCTATAGSREPVSTVKQHMAAIRMLFSWLTEKGVLAMSPAREVKTERFSRTEGKTPAFVEGEVEKLLNVIETVTHTGLRDRALLGTLAYTFADRRRGELEGRRLLSFRETLSSPI